MKKKILKTSGILSILVIISLVVFAYLTNHLDDVKLDGEDWGL